MMPDPFFRPNRFGLALAAWAVTLAGSASAAVILQPLGTGASPLPQVLHLAQVVAPPIPQTSAPSDEREGSDDDTPSVGVAEEVHETRLAGVVEILSEGSRTCQSVSDDYRVDCIAKHLRAAATTLPRDKAFDEAQRTLSAAAAQLERLVRQNADPTQPRVTVPLSSPTRTKSPPLQAMAPSASDATRAQALQVLEEATTVLLRSAATTQGRATHFQRIADALNSNKVLLRS